METSLLQTKLYIPPIRPTSSVILRPRLIERLNKGTSRKLTLISAPAGFGKTMVVSIWISDLRITIDDLQAETASQAKIANPKPVLSEVEISKIKWLGFLSTRPKTTPPAF
jgi:hypothetical protein